MRIERTLSFVKTLGPGERFVIWTNGCPRKCPGCVSERLQVANPNTEEDVESYFQNIDLSLYDGITISGGDPFMDYEELLVALKYFKSRGVKDILVYTGYTLEEINENERMKECLKYIDVLIDGPYIESQNDNKHNLRGSNNQRIIFLNESLKEKYEAYIKDERHMEEYRRGNFVTGVGIPTKEYIEEFKKRR